MMAITEEAIEAGRRAAIGRICSMAQFKGANSVGIGRILTSAMTFSPETFLAASEYFGVDDIETALWLNVILEVIVKPNVRQAVTDSEY